jgi:Pyruvate/2-oxoacid:ferredoxin oxidoreductase gamma subunit
VADFWNPTRSAALQRLSRDEPGTIERALRDLGVTSTTVLLRAAAIDQAGEQLIRDNQQAAAERRRRFAPADASKSATPTGPASHLLTSVGTGTGTGTGTVGSRRPSASAHSHEAEAES